MSLNNISNVSNDTYKLDSGSGSLFDSNIPSSPYNWIKTKAKMGISSAPLYDISSNIKNLIAYTEYGKAQFKGSSTATTIDNNGQPLGNRYFVAAAGGKKCIDKDDKIVDQYYVVDGMAANKDSSANGLSFSAINTLGNIDSKNINSFFEDLNDPTLKSIRFKNSEDNNDYNKCTKIKLITDGYGNKEEQYVNNHDAKKLLESGIATKVEEKIEKVEKSEGFQSYSNNYQIVKGHNGWSRSMSATNIGGYIIGADITDTNDTVYFHPQNIVVTNIPSMYSSYAIVEDSDDKEYLKSQEWVNNQIALQKQIIDATNDIKQNKKEYNTITGFFLGSVTVIGLYIVFRLLDRSAVSKFK